WRPRKYRSWQRFCLNRLMTFNLSREYEEHKAARDQGGAEGSCAVVDAIHIFARLPGVTYETATGS
ncbi:MAG: hypothetical protein ABJ059_22510, partial [Hyphomicrobiales bacterium]